MSFLEGNYLQRCLQTSRAIGFISMATIKAIPNYNMLLMKKSVVSSLTIFLKSNWLRKSLNLVKRK